MPPSKKRKTSHPSNTTLENPDSAGTKHRTRSSTKPKDETTRVSDNKPDTSTPDTSETHGNVTHHSVPSSKPNKPIQLSRYLPTTSHQAGTRKVLLITHGAGGDHTSPAMVEICTELSQHLEVVSFTAHGPLASRADRFKDTFNWRCSLASEADTSDTEIVVGGRSMGARAAVVFAKSQPNVKKVLCLSYPLISPKGEVRDEILKELTSNTDVLFVSGEKDTMCDFARLQEIRSKMNAESAVVIVEGAGHGLNPSGVRGEQTRRGIGEIVAKWINNDNGDVGEAGDRTLKWDGDKIIVSPRDDSDDLGP